MMEDNGLEEENFLIAKNIDRNLRGAQVTQSSSMIYVMNILTAVMGIIVFGLGLHLALQGFGASKMVFIIAMCGIFTTVLALLCFYGIKILIQDVDSSIAIALLRLYINGGSMFAFISCAFGFALIAYRSLMIRYLVLHWNGNLELVMASMSIGQGINYMNQSIAIFVVIVILIAVVIAYSTFMVWKIIPSNETVSQFALWVHLTIGSIAIFLFGFTLYQLYRPSYSQNLPYSMSAAILGISLSVLIVQCICILRIAALSRSAWFTSFCLCWCCSRFQPSVRKELVDEERESFDHRTVLEPTGVMNTWAIATHVILLICAMAISIYGTAVVGSHASSLAFNNSALSFVNTVPTAMYDLYKGSASPYGTIYNEFVTVTSKMVSYTIFSSLLLIDVLLIVAIYFAIYLKPYTIKEKTN